MVKSLAIVPAWNEEQAIGATLAEIAATNPGLDVLVVDDGSTDRTAEIAKASGATVLRLPFNLGLGGAMRAGYEYAQRYDYDQAIQCDADGQHDPQEIPRVLAGLQVADISVGARFAGRGDYDVRGPRRWGMSLLAAIISRVAHTKLTDVTSGFRAADRKAIAQYCRHMPAEYLGDCIDAYVIALRSGCTTTQVPVRMRERQAGTPSNGPVKAAVNLARALFALLIALTRRPTSGKE